MVSILILTFNEERNLPECLASVNWSDDVVVFDSFSSDLTLEIAKAAGARCMQRKFDNYASQRNASLQEVSFKNSWVFVLDADERVPPELRTELEGAVAAADPEMTMYRLRRKDFFLGRWLRRSGGYPTWFPRLMQPTRVRVEREINEEFHTEGKVGNLCEHLIHLPFNKGIAFWLERHNRYSTMEAEALVKETREAMRWSGLFRRDPVVRRKALKQLAYRLPCRPMLVFCYLYFVRMGFLDGRPGWHYCRLRAMYENMIDLKVQELRRRERGLPV
ncbi:MAG: glycosyltransferase family 2 protein [Kiritimatiellia bacterium]